MDEAFEFETDTDDGLNMEREVLRLLARDVADYGTREDINAATNALLDIIGPILMSYYAHRAEYFNEAARRAVLIEAIRRIWYVRLQGRAPKIEEFRQMFNYIIRAVGDDPTYGLPKPRRTRQTKQSAAIVSLLTPRTPEEP